MQKIYDGNFWECKVKDAAAGTRYKYRITDEAGKVLDHCDPYGFSAEKRPNTASVICGLGQYQFQDQRWMKRRKAAYDEPLHIYEFRFGSWRRKSDKPDDWYSYRELPELLIPYLKDAGYNYIEIMPLNEHPCDESWGYQATGFFAPTSRYGTPDDLRFFIDRCHESGIGVIIDFAPVHFAIDDYALSNYDGTAIYEYPHSDVGRSEWGSCNFMHSRGEVQSFLQSAAFYWLKEFHFDGIRVDVVSKLTFSMHYFHSEKYLLPLSHDEVVHGKATIIQKMNGDYEAKFPAMYQEDYTGGFKWIDCHQENRCIYAFERSCEGRRCFLYSISQIKSKRTTYCP